MSSHICWGHEVFSATNTTRRLKTPCILLLFSSPQKMRNESKAECQFHHIVIPSVSLLVPQREELLSFEDANDGLSLGLRMSKRSCFVLRYKQFFSHLFAMNTCSPCTISPTSSLTYTVDHFLRACAEGRIAENLHNCGRRRAATFCASLLHNSSALQRETKY